MKKNFFLLFILFLLRQFSFAQNEKIDSLLQAIKTLPTSGITKDTIEIKTFNELYREYRTIGEPEKALGYSNKALEVAKKISGSPVEAVAGAAKKGIANSYNNIGVIYCDQSDYPKAFEYFFKSLKVREEIKDKNGTASSYNNIGLIYHRQSDYPKALEYYLKSVKIKVETGDKKGIAASYNNIGLIYHRQSDYPKALEYYFRGLKIKEEIGNKKDIATSYNNIGVIYCDQSNYPKALEYHFKGLKIKKEVGDKIGVALSYNNIGKVYADLAEQADSVKRAFIVSHYTDAQKFPSLAILNKTLLDSALSCQLKALQIQEELGDKYDITYSLSGIGDILNKRQKHAQALPFYRRAAMLANSISAQAEQKTAAEGLYFCYKKLNKPDSALYWHEKAVMLKDSIFSSEKQKELGRQEANFEYQKKEALDKAAHEKELALSAEQRKQQQLISYSAGGGLAIVLLFSLVIAKRLQVTRRQKGIIEMQQTEVKSAYAILHEKNKDITDSINYAKRIQQALLKEEEYAFEHLPEHFILFKPKDIVSGDFYWSYEKEVQKGKKTTKYWYMAAVDCTGHGVPGAFMSMLGVAFLNEINTTEQLLCPHEILNQLRTKVLKELHQTGKEGESKDGMDISLIRLNLSTNELQWAGANNPLWLFSGEKFTELKPDKQPIGFHHTPIPFTSHSIQLNKGDSVYIFTDGYADQFGGEKGKKFKYKQLQELLLANSKKPMNEQKAVLNNTIENWKGNLEQVDDVLVIGMRVK
ncbi:MAG: tetratricopeptide repeat protein [Bacteroidota bacterium]